MRAWGIALLIGAFVTLVWIFVCPTYWYVGQTGTQHTVSWINGPSHQSEDYQHLDGMTFFAGEIVIWAAIAGACLLRRELTQWFGGSTMPPQSSPSLAAEAQAATAANREPGHS